MKSCLFILSILPVLLVLQCSSKKTKPHCCPNFTIPQNVSDPFLLQEYKRIAIKEVWARPLFRKETPLLLQLKEIILEMADADSILFTDLASVYSAWGTGFFNNIERHYPNLCSLALAINKTVEWNQCDDNKLYIEALEATHKAISIGLSGVKFATLHELGCKSVPEPNEDSRSCWNNGFSAAHDELWEYFGPLLPWSLHDIIHELLCSHDFTERAAATVFNFVLIPQVHYFWSITETLFFIEYSKFFTQATNSSVSKCCCNEWGSKIDKLTINIQNIVNNAVTAKVEEINSDDC